MEQRACLFNKKTTATQKLEVSALSDCSPRGNDALTHNVLIAATLITASLNGEYLGHVRFSSPSQNGEMEGVLYWPWLQVSERN